VRSCIGIALLCVACGGAPRASSTLEADLAALGVDGAATRAPDLVRSAHAASVDARAADDRGDHAAAADDATLARLYAQSAVDEAARLEAADARLAAERETIDAETELHAIETTRQSSSAELARLAAARTAREEGARALAQAEIDESRPGRSRQDSVSDASEMRQAARAIRDRARLLSAAATALGAPASTEVDGLVTQSEEATAPLDQVRLADRAHTAARARLAAARRARPAVDATRIASLVEAAESEGFHAVRLDRGVGIELEDVFAGSATRPSHAAEGRLARLATLITSYPDGPVRVEIDSATSAEVAHVAAPRAASVVHALVTGGLDASRVSAADPLAVDGTPSPRARVRVVLVAYVETPPASGGAIPSAPAPGPPSATESE
jgi:hypothetical protein